MCATKLTNTNKTQNDYKQHTPVTLNHFYDPSCVFGFPKSTMIWFMRTNSTRNRSLGNFVDFDGPNPRICVHILVFWEICNLSKKWIFSQRERVESGFPAKSCPIFFFCEKSKAVSLRGSWCGLQWWCWRPGKFAFLLPTRSTVAHSFSCCPVFLLLPSLSITAQ